MQYAFSFDMFDAPEAPVQTPPVSKRPLAKVVERVVAPPSPWQPHDNGIAEPVAHRIGFTLTDTMLASRGSAKQKYRANIEAIQLLDQLQKEGRAPTADDKAVFARYAGWGGCPQPFAGEVTSEWQAEAQELRAVLGDRFAAARDTTPNAHYTPVAVIDAMWAAVQRLGFKGGRIIEPSAGIGHFLGRMPAELRPTTQVTAVEIEPVTGAMLKCIYPEADVRISPFEKCIESKGGYDLAIGNVPFGDYRVSDPEYDAHRLFIHNYFIMKCCNLVRQGGIVALITTTSTMDGYQSGKFRAWLEKFTEIVAAWRLPNGAFAESANTEVATDVLFLKVTRRPRVEVPLDNHVSCKALLPSWHHTSEHLHNKYWADHPHNVLGKWTAVRGKYAYTLGVERRDTFELELSGAVQRLPESVMDSGLPTSVRRLEPDLSGAMEGELKRDDMGVILRFEGGAWLPVPPRESRRVSLLFSIGRTLDALLAEQNSADADEDRMNELRAELSERYTAFVADYGPITKRANVLVVRNWSKLPLLLSLELWDERKQTAERAAIFTKRTTAPPKLVERADTVEAALTISFGQTLRVDPVHIGKLLGVSPEEAIEQLEAKNLTYFDPLKGRHVLAEEYLSGDVREKLEQIEAFAQADAKYLRNRTALTAVQPADLAAHEIRVQLGAHWLPTGVITAFVREITGNDHAEVRYSQALSLWEVSSGWSTQEATLKWGTPDKAPSALLEAAMNGKRPTVYVYGTDPAVVDIVATAAARERAERIQERFLTWVWEDKARADELVALYNRRFNAEVPRQYSGAFLTLPDLSTDVSLRDSQREAVARGLLGGSTGVFHKTGAGKTMVLCTIAHEMRRLGLAQKSVIVVQNSTLYQFAAEYIRLFPNARILVPDRDELSGTKRRAMIAKIATGDWEAVIIAHSSLDRLPMGEGAMEVVKDILLQPIHDELATAQSGDVKALVKAGKRAEAMLDSLTTRKHVDGHLKFEDLAVDALLIDEAHRFKNLWFFSGRERVAGMQQAASRRALDLYAKAQWLYARHGRTFGLVMATATPITNTIAEIYTMQRFLQPDVLRRAGLQNFDAWATMFGEVVSSVEVSPTGRGFRVHERFARFHNVPELMRLYLKSADIKNKTHLSKVLNEPDVAGGAPQIVAAKCHPEQSAFIDTLVERAALLKEERIDPRIDNMLKIVHEGRMVALEQRLMIPAAPDWEGSKVNLAVEKILQHWEEGRETRSTQLVFCDLSVPHRDGRPSVYDDIRAKLVNKGVPGEEIAFAQYAETDRARATLFQQVRDGVIRIVLGSTERLGTGANVQDRVVAMHHLDVPWRPSDLEQRDGRGIRQGNKHEAVHIYRYVTEGSFDAYMWQTAETKAKFILQVMDPEMKLRSIEDIAVATLSYAEVKAAASGDPVVMEKIAVDAELAKLDLLHAAEQSRVRRLRWTVGENARTRESTEIQIGMVQEALDELQTRPVEDEITFTSDGCSRWRATQCPDDAIVSALNRASLASQSRFMRSKLGTIGRFLLRWSEGEGFSIELVGRRDVRVDLGRATTGRGMARLYAAIPEAFAECLRNLHLSREQLIRGSEEAEAQLAAPWEHQKKFDALLARRAELDKLLALNVSENTAGLVSAAAEPSDGAEAPEEEECETA